MGFKAKYRGHCEQCDEAIVVGDDVEYDDDELLHSRCLLKQGSPAKTLQVCGQCWTVHAGECI